MCTAFSAQQKGCVQRFAAMCNNVFGSTERLCTACWDLVCSIFGDAFWGDLVWGILGASCVVYSSVGFSVKRICCKNPTSVVQKP